MNKFTYFKTMLLAVVLLVGSASAWGQLPVNGGFEATFNTATDWTTTGIQSSAWARTGTYSLLSSSSTSESNVAHTNTSSISVAASGYAHVIGWAKGTNDYANASIGSTINNSTSSTNTQTIGTTLTQLVHNRQNSTTGVLSLTCRVNTRSSTSGNATQVYWDDIIMYTDATSTADVTSPIAPTSFTAGTITASSAGFSWTNGSDAGTGIQNTIILRTTNLSAATPTLNNQGVYSTTGGTAGPNVVSTDWTVISTSIGSSETTYTDNTVTQSSSYLYAVIHRDLAYNYSTALVSGTITTPASDSPTITINPTSLTGFTYLEGSGPATSQSYNLSGSNLTGFPGNITITGSTDYEVSTDNTNFSNSVTVAYSNATLTSTPIYVRLKSELSAGNYYSETITNSGGGATVVNVTCNGSVTIPVYYFKSKTTGNWSSPSTWESSSDNSTWSDASRAPSSLDYTITILNGHTVTVDAAVTADEVVIANGGKLSTGTNLTVNNGTGDDITVQNGGKIIYTGAPTYSSSTIRIQTGGILSVQAASLTGNGTGVNASTHIYDNGAILEWNLATGVPSASGVTYFPNVDAFTVPIFRFTSGTSNSIGGNNPTIFNGQVEIISGVNITLTGTGNKNIRNGVHLLGTSSLTVNTKLTCASLEVDAGSTLTVNAGQQLTVSTALTNNGTLNLLSSDSGTATILMPASASVTANVEQYTDTIRNWYISIPISTYTPTGTVYEYYEPNNTWSSPTVLKADSGYIIKPGTVGAKITFSGTLNNGNQSATLTRSTTNTLKSGFNLVGNPYPSYVNARTAVNSATNLEKTIWYRTTKPGYNKTYVFETFNTVSGLIGTNLSGRGGVIGTIPPMQSFWVRVKEGQTTATLNFTNTLRSHFIQTPDTISNPLRVKATNNASQQVLRLQVSDGINQDEAIVYFNANATDGYDNYDSQKMSNGNTSVIPEIYTMVENKELVFNGMNTIPYDVEIPLYFKANAVSVGSFSLSATEMSNFEAGTQVLVKNNLSGAQQIISDRKAYTFDASAVGSNPAFSLIFKAPGVIDAIPSAANDQNLFVYRNANNQIAVQIKGQANDAYTLNVYNSVGQRLASKQAATGMTFMDVPQAGVYFVTIKGNGVNTTKKVVIN